MSYSIEFTDKALEGIEKLKKSGNKPVLKKIGEAPTFVRNFPSNISIETEGLKIYFFKPLKTHSINILLAGD